MKKILMVEDHVIVRQGLIRTLKDELDFPAEFHEASTAEQALEMAGANSYDLVLLDISLPDQNGMIVLEKLCLLDPRLPVIILSSHLEEQYAVRAIRQGAAAYINKGSASADLKRAIDKVLTGKKYISEFQAELLVETLSDFSETTTLHQALSEREFQVANMITSGQTLSGIAESLGMSVSTVSTYRIRVLNKLQLKTTSEIISYFLRHKLS